MSTSESNDQLSAKELLANQLEQQLAELDPFLMADGIDFSLLREHHLQSLFLTLLQAHQSDRSNSQLDPASQKTLVQFCIQVVDCDELVGPNLDTIRRCKLWAVRLLVIIARQPFVEPHSREILNLIYTPLVNKLHVPIGPDDEFELKPSTKQLMCLVAHCLSQPNFSNILSRVEAKNLIMELVLPLATWCLRIEAKPKKSAFLDLVGHICDFFFSSTKILAEDKDLRYLFPVLCRLQLLLGIHSESGQFCDYPKEFDSILDTALRTGAITDKHIVMLYNIRVCNQGADLDKRLADFLTKSQSLLHRQHIAGMFLYNFGNDAFSEYRITFANEMINQLITSNDELSDEIALKSIERLKEYKRKIDWDKLIAGKELDIMRKLVAINAEPEVYELFLGHFNHLPDSPSSSEFDELAQMPISKVIKQIRFMLLNSSNTIGYCEQLQLRDCIRCLENLLRLRRHRLEEDKELELEELFNLLSELGPLIGFERPGHGFMLVFANCYQVRPSAWSSIIKLIKFAHHNGLLDRLDTDESVQYAPDTINVTLSYFFTTHSHYFWTEFVSLEVLELIYKYIERVANSCFTKIPFHGILSTWPDSYEKTRLGADDYRTMLNKFIGLFMNTFEKDKKRVGFFQLPARSNRYVELLYGLLAAFGRHGEILHATLDSLGHKREERDTWLSEHFSHWIQLTVDGRLELYHNANCILGGRFRLRGLAPIVGAYEGLKFINEHFHDCSKLTKSSKDLLEAIKLALDDYLERAPVDSIESKIYQQIKASLLTS